MGDFFAAGWDAGYAGAGLFWKALRALALGYAISAAIQVFVSRGRRPSDSAPAPLGRWGWRCC